MFSSIKQPAWIKAGAATPHGLGEDVNVDNVLKAIEELGVVVASQNVIDRSFGHATSAELLAFAKEEVAHTLAFVAQQAIASLNASDTSHLYSRR